MQVLTTKDDLVAVAEAIYTALQPSGQQRKLHQVTISANLATLLGAVGEVRKALQAF